MANYVGNLGIIKDIASKGYLHSLGYLKNGLYVGLNISKTLAKMVDNGLSYCCNNHPRETKLIMIAIPLIGFGASIGSDISHVLASPPCHGNLEIILSQYTFQAGDTLIGSGHAEVTNGQIPDKLDLVLFSNASDKPIAHVEASINNGNFNQPVYKFNGSEGESILLADATAGGCDDLWDAKEITVISKDSGLR